VDTANRSPVVQVHPKAPGASPERLERGIDTIPYTGPEILLDLADTPGILLGL
jgi:hypothetical protein